MTDFVTVNRGDAPLVIGVPHAGTDIPEALEDGYVSSCLARKDADWWIDRLYAFAADMGATIVATAISRSVIDVNRDPSGVSLYPGQATTELCPTTTFDGEPLYHPGAAPDAAEVARRTTAWFDPYHGALADEIDRLRAAHPTVVLYDAHSIRSWVPRLFDGELPQFNIGTDGGTTCDRRLRTAVARACEAGGESMVVDGRFRGGWTTRRYGQPATGVHAIQMELAMRGYLDEPADVHAGNWPAPLDPARAERLRATLASALDACLDFARSPA